MTGEQIRIKRVVARIPGDLICKHAGVSRGRLSCIERGLVSARVDELARLERALDELTTARRKVAERAAEVGWPM